MTARNPHDPYIAAVFDAMLGVPQPDNCWVSDAETGSDGETCTLSAVLIWEGEVSPDLYPDGLLVCWDLECGWQYAGNRHGGCASG